MGSRTGLSSLNIIGETEAVFWTTAEREDVEPGASSIISLLLLSLPHSVRLSNSPLWLYRLLYSSNILGEDDDDDVDDSRRPS